MTLKRISGEPGANAWFAAILAAVAIVYSRCLTGEFVLDDHKQIVGNRYLGQWSFIWKSFARDSWWFRDPAHLPQSFYYRPIQNAWFALNFHLWGLYPAGWRAATIAIHLLAVWLVYRIAARLCENRTAGLGAAALFGLMPLNAEAVAWAIAPVLAAVFELAAFDAYLAGSRARRALSLGFFAGALLSVESAAVFPALIVAHTFFLPDTRNLTPCPPSPSGKGERNSESSPLPLGGGVSARLLAAFLAAWPYAIVLAAYLIVRVKVLGFLFTFQPDMGARMTVGALALTIPRIVAGYAILLAAPWLAGPYHPIEAVRSAAAPGFWLPAAVLAAICAAGLLLLRRHPHRRLYLFCVAWFVIALGPVVNLGVLAIRDRYAYLPLVGLCVIAADLAVTFARQGAIRMRWVSIGAAIVAVAYAGILFHVEYFWHSDVDLYARYIEEAPQEGIWRNRMGMALAARGDYAAARGELRKAMALEPHPGENLYYDLALIDERLGDRNGAADAMAMRLQRMANPPPQAVAAYALAAETAGDANAAAGAIARAAALPGGRGIAALARAQISFMHGDSRGAESALEEILKGDPDNVHARALLGMALAAQKRYGAALAEFRRAEALAPRDPNLHYRAALTLHRMGREREARAECAAALGAAPGNPEMRALWAEIDRSGAQ
ncbi:MAG: tetratricopeptide repeat protein [Candidatus Binataceae bacterium]